MPHSQEIGGCRALLRQGEALHPYNPLERCIITVYEVNIAVFEQVEHAMKANKQLNPMTIGLLGFIGQISAMNQSAQWSNEASWFVWQSGWYIHNHTLTLIHSGLAAAVIIV